MAVPIHPLRLRLRPGFLLLEVLVGMTIFALFLTTVSLVLLNGQQDTVSGGDRIRAAYLADGALEAARSMRNMSFSKLTAGNHGVVLALSGAWVFNGATVVSSGTYTTGLAVTTLASDWKQIVATSSWKHGNSRSGSVSFTTQLVDWRGMRTTGNWGSPSLVGTYIDGGTPLFNAVAVSGNAAFVTGDVASGGPGLTVIDLTTLTSPQRVASSFSLGSTAYGVAVKGKRLYVALANTSQELRVYDISNPASLSAANLVASYNLPGSSRARSLAVRGNVLYVGAMASGTAGEDEFYTFDVSNSGAIVPLGSLADTGDMNAIGLLATGAYVASTLDTSELRVVNIADNSTLSFASGQGYNLADGTQDATSIAVVGTSALLGRQRGTAIQEIVLFDVRNGAIPSSPGPWYHEASGGVVAVDVDPTGCYGFAATTWGLKALQVINLKNHSLPEVSNYSNGAVAARGVSYDIVRDRLYLLTNQRFLIFAPGASASPCS